MKPYTVTTKPSQVQKQWWIVDAEGVVLGRLASIVAKMLRGKHKPTYTPHIDTGDHVVIINAEKVRLTGRKVRQKVYYRHTGYAGGIKEQTPEFIFSSPHPQRVVEKAIERMLPKDSPLARDQYAKLRVYAGKDHPHEAQQPKVLDIAAMNPKNKR